MTGFSSANITLTRADGTKTQATISLKSLNSRFFEVTARLPFALANLETNITKRLKKQLLRGHIYLTAHVANAGIFKGNIEPDLSTINRYVKAFDAIKSHCNITTDYSLDTLLVLPNIFIIQELGLEKEIKEQFLEVIDQLIEHVIQAQESEGTALHADLINRITALQTEISIIKDDTEKTVSATKHKIAAATAQLEGADRDSFEQARSSALHAFLDKIDIHEEIVRFESHLHTLQSFLENKVVEKGKRVDFTLQELMREINTIAAKSADAAITSRAIDIKVELEKAREQAQNIV